MDIEVTIYGMDFVQEGNQILEGSSQPIYRPNEDQIEILSDSSFDQTIKSLSLISSLGS
jgi:hypothetical protein